MRNNIHRDMCKRVIQMGDMVVWGSRRQGYEMRLARVVGFHAKTVQVHLIVTDKKTKADPRNLLVITAQMTQNIDDGVGSGLEPPEDGVNTATSKKHTIAGQTARSWFEARGISVQDHLKTLQGEPDDE